MTKKRKENPSEGELESSEDGQYPAIRIVVAGERRTGKSSLIAAAAERGKFNTELSFTLPDTHLPGSVTGYGVPLTIMDTSQMYSYDTGQKLKQADGIVLTYSCDRINTFEKLRTNWLPRLRELKLDNVPVIVVGCRQDLRRDIDGVWKDFFTGWEWPIKDFPNVKTCLECSAKICHNVEAVFPSALRAIQGTLEYKDQMDYE